MKLCVAIALLLLPLFSFAQVDGPIGWASLNGGTTGGAGGETVTVTTRSQFNFYVSSHQPYIIQVQDTIHLNLYERIVVRGNKTILGLGHNATLLYGGLEIKGDNVIIQNIRITGSYDGDWDGNDLRIASIVNVTNGAARILNNRISYTSDRQSNTDTIWYQIVDTQGGLDTGMVMIEFGVTTNVDDLSAPEKIFNIYPNPITTEALIAYESWGEEADIRIQVLDVKGSVCHVAIRSLNAPFQKGIQRYTLNINYLKSGIYFVKIQEGRYTATKQITVIK